MFKVAVAHSLELDSVDAVTEVLEQCREQLGNLNPQAGIMFAGIDHDFALILNEINRVNPMGNGGGVRLPIAKIARQPALAYRVAGCEERLQPTFRLSRHIGE